jgi:outer membrane receptor protein involved in Fe transport
VLTGGASATYGSDAIAGVINFIMKKNFEGFQVDASFGGNWHDNHSSYTQQAQIDAGGTPLTGDSTDGQTMAINVLAGTSLADGRGNVTAYFGYMKNDPVKSSDRDFGGCQLNPDDDLAGAHCAGSQNSNYWQPQTGPNAFGEYSVLGNSFIDFDSAETNPPAFFNSQPYIYMQRGDERYTAGFMGHLDMTDHFQVYTEFGYMNDRSHQEVAPAAAFLFSNPNDPISGNYNINCSNPLMSAQQALTLCTQAEIDADAAAIASGGAPVTQRGDRSPQRGRRRTQQRLRTQQLPRGAGRQGRHQRGVELRRLRPVLLHDLLHHQRPVHEFQRHRPALLVKRDANGNVCLVAAAACPGTSSRIAVSTRTSSTFSI